MTADGGPCGRPVERRRLLRGATAFAGLGVTGCRGRSAALPVSASKTAGPLLLPVISGPAELTPALLPAFNSGHPTIRVFVVHGITPYPLGLGGARQDPLKPLPQQFEPLGAALRLANFSGAGLLPGSVEAFSEKDEVYALPVTQFPLAVRWRSDAFAAAGMEPPADDWTLADFTAACTLLQGAAAAGRIPGLRAAVGPILGIRDVMDANGRLALTLVGSLYEAGLWQGFARGFGGQVVAGGRFTLRQPATLAGLQALLDLTRRFALPPDAIPDRLAAMPAFPDLFALRFTPFVPGAVPVVAGAPVYDARWKWARLPRFPVDPVIPTSLLGQGLATTGPSALPAATVVTQIAAAGTFLLWLYGAQAQSILLDRPYAPIVADAATQEAFWSQRVPEARAVGDWRHFANYAQGWPVMAGNAIVARALEAAAAAPGTLAAHLAQAEQQMNAGLGR